MSESINRVIKDYLESPKTDYAIMISGEWGCGKSHYIHNEFVDMIKTVTCPKEDNSNGERFYKPAFVSLYGVSSSEDFEYRVFCGISVGRGFGWMEPVIIEDKAHGGKKHQCYPDRTWSECTHALWTKISKPSHFI